MPLKHAMVGVGATLLFAVGVAAAFAESPPPTTTDTTTTTTTSTTETTTTTSLPTTTETTTSTSPAPTTTLSTTTTTPLPPSTTPRAAANDARGSRGRIGADVIKAGKRPLAHPKKRRRHRISKPLKVTPPLGQDGYVFPLVGDSGYIDTYGDFRSDVHGKWHHGDDIFGALGTPVVAVASGTINRVGWRKAGGWRLWVRDSLANQFYYAHLAGYARTVFHSRYVRAGQVIGFVGNTGDAFPGAPHLHFEIHPHQLLRLGYDGAVNPTSYLDSWTHLPSVDAPPPMHPRLPKSELVRLQAQEVFGRLLVARHLLRSSEAQQPAGGERATDPEVSAPLAVRRAALVSGPTTTSSPLTMPLLVGSASLALAAISLLLVRLALRRIREQPDVEPRP